MADALVSVVLEQLSSIIIQEVQREVRLVVGVENEVKKLTSNFQAIQAVFADAEERQLKDQLVKHWLDQLKDVSYDMDDILDEWGTAIAKSQSKVNEHPRKNTRKVCSFMIFSCFRFREVGLRRDIALKIKELNERIDGIVIEKNKFHFKSSEVVIKQHDHRKTVSFIDVAEVKGRETDKGRVKKMLLSESSQGPALRTISLVGMGGIGKTTLAQLVYNDHEVENHFDKRIWVCVSDPFDETKIAKAILEALKGSASDLIELQALLENIQPLITGKKFLLVLDDVWNEDSIKWEQLRNSLKCGCLPGSSILVTTRKRNVANCMGSSSSTDILELGLLSTDECWSLFSHLAFFDENSGERGNLEDIGRKIAAKCKGLPLAVKCLGSLLRFKSRIEDWESVLNSHVWEIKEAESNLLAPLWLSYHDLPSEMRPCFLYCAVFPKDFTFERDTLIKLWMAQGFLRETRNKEMELMGRECFEALAARSFFQDFEKDEDDGSIYACKMHDMVHDFAQNLTKNECFNVDIDGPTESKIDSFSRDARHSMVVFRNDETNQLPATIHSFKKLRSLIVDGHHFSLMNAALPNLITNLSCLKTLKLSRCGIEEVPSNIGKLIHLRHVDLSWNKIKELPEEMCELYNMLTLDVSRCKKLERLPDNIGRLVKLRHLSVLNLQFVKMRGVEGLSSLRELDDFHVSGSDKESNIGDLRNLNYLQGSLTISWLGDVKNPDEVKKAELKSKKHLTGLGLWFGSRTNREKINDDEVLEALEPPPNIYSLTIRYYQGVILLRVFPGWINRLRVVTLWEWIKIENLPPLGKLPSLEELSLYGMGCVGRVGREFLGLGVDNDLSIGEMTSSSSSSNTIIVFPKLKSLSFFDMEKWEEWEGGEGGNKDKTNISISTIMLSLRSLKIIDCPKVKALPDYVLQSTTLEKLVILHSPIIGAQFKAGGKGWPNASHTPNITVIL
ncbi:putative disease resistance protein RGA3 [Populus alba]|uniref:Disease resistance protein RGA3 n=1 Tax=Populus alba x Populus x berolinensis TaxID=444605 RepID=A0AAD6LAZ7_9ROSI|nr:disease resistance protein RGA3 [Populus alba x Populus x berolinensis]